jgi:hypothetical protein
MLFQSRTKQHYQVKEKIISYRKYSLTLEVAQLLIIINPLTLIITNHLALER